MSNELIKFLRARLDEDEKAAHAAASVCGCHPEVPAWSFGDETTDGRIVLVDDPHPETRRKIGRRWNGSYEGLFMARHVVRHDPARVLREVEARRRMLRHYENAATALANAGPSGEVRDLMTGAVNTLRAVLLDHAQIYADHPGYRQEWTP